MVNENQKKINDTIEMMFVQLVKNGNVDEFTKTMQQNIDTKRESSTSKIDFFDRLMLNIAYFVENKKAWEKMLSDILTTKVIPTKQAIATDALQYQMMIRESIANQTEAYKEQFHNQYEELNVSTEDVIYDYAYASVEHSLRYDFLSFMTMHPSAKQLLEGDAKESLRVIDGYVAYYADQFVNQMELK